MSLTAKLADRLRTMFDSEPCERSLLAAQTIELMIDKAVLKAVRELRVELMPAAELYSGLETSPARDKVERLCTCLNRRGGGRHQANCSQSGQG